MSESMTTEQAKNTAEGAVVRESIIQAVNFQVNAIVGHASLTISELQNLEGGSVIPLSTALNETISLQLNGVEVARGELVSVDDNFAVKITHVAQ